MKKILLFTFSVFLFEILSFKPLISANEHFRSIASGNWNAILTWEMSTNGGSIWFPAIVTPNDTSGTITVRSPNTVTVTSNVNADEIVVNSGGTLSVNSSIVLSILDGAGTDLHNLGSVTGAGTVQTKGAGTVVITRNTNNFSASLKVNTGNTNLYSDASPFDAILKGSITVDAGAVLTGRSGAYTIIAYNSVTNNGTIAGINNSAFTVKGSSMTNSGSVSINTLNFDSVTSLSGSGTFTGQDIVVGATGNVTLLGNVTFSPVTSFSINTGGVFNPGSKTFTFTSGTFVLNSGATVAGSGPSAGTMQTQGTVSFDFKTGAVFNSALKINTGTLTAYNSSSPYTASIYGNITIDAGAVLHCYSGSYTLRAYGNVTNNGTLAGINTATFSMRGSNFINNGSVTVNYFDLDSVTSLSGTGSFTSNYMRVGIHGNVSLLSNVTFSPVIQFEIYNGGVLNPNTRVFNFKSGTFRIYSGGTTSNSGTFQTQDTVDLICKSGSNFNSPLKINTGITTGYDDDNPYIGSIKGTITIDAGAKLNCRNGAFTIRAYNNVTNNGTITGLTSSKFSMRGPVFTNNGSVANANFYFDSTTSISGAGSYTSSNMFIGGTGNVSLSNNVTFSPVLDLTINTGGLLNLNSMTLTFNSGSFISSSGTTVSGTGLFQTQGNVSLIVKNGSVFNPPVKINTGITTVYDNSTPYIAVLKGDVTIDAGAAFNVNSGGYTAKVFGNVINNGTISGASSASFRFYGPGFTNNGSVTVNNFYFDTASHTLQGTGSFVTVINIINNSTVTLTSNHQFSGLEIAAGGSLNLSSNKIYLTASNPITNSGTFTTTGSTIEYNGTSAQSVSAANIVYHNLRINNTAGVTLLANATVDDTLSLINGDLNLNGKIITVSSSGYLTETAGNVLTGSTGYITTTRNINAPSSLNVAGFGAVLTSSVNLGSTEIRRGHTIDNNLGGNTSIQRFYDILPATNTGLNATLVFNYYDSELNGKIEQVLNLFRSTNSGTSWTLRGGTVNTAANTITLSGIDAFSRWSASSTAALAAQIKVIVEGFYNSSTNRLSKKDTVRAYLRDNSSPFAIVDSAKSVIDSITFTGNFLFANAVSGTYYIQIIHRNSIETWSKSGGQAYTLGSALTYDFTGSASQAYGSNMIQVDASPVRYGIYSGDVNQDGSIEASDISEVDNDAYSSAGGYVRTDLNGDNFVDAADLSVVDNNVFSFVSVIRP